MTDKTKKRLLYGALVISGIIIIWLLLSKTKVGQNIIKQVQSAFNIPEFDITAKNFGEQSEFDLPPLPDYGDTIFGNSDYGNCSLCYNTNTVVKVPAAPVQQNYTGEISPQFLLPDNIKKIKYDDRGNIKKIKFYAEDSYRENRTNIVWS